MNKKYCKQNGKKGGRPSSKSGVRVYLPDFELIVLTPNQYGTLLEKYGYKILHKSLEILQKWLQTSPQAVKYRGKNNYAHFRSDGWVINTAKISVEKT